MLVSPKRVSIVLYARGNASGRKWKWGFWRPVEREPVRRAHSRGIVDAEIADVLVIRDAVGSQQRSSQRATTGKARVTGLCSLLWDLPSPFSSAYLFFSSGPAFLRFLPTSQSRCSGTGKMRKCGFRSAEYEISRLMAVVRETPYLMLQFER
jgi:hypothetical protein